MQIALLTFDGFDEVSTFLTLGMLARLRPRGWRAALTSPTAHVTSAAGVHVAAGERLEHADRADAVVFGHSDHARALASDPAVLDRLNPDPVRQRYAAQCGGTLLLARLGLMGTVPAASDPATRPWLLEAGVRLSADAFSARRMVATAGGPLAALYVATWLIWHGEGEDAARDVLQQTLPVRDEAGAERVMGIVRAQMN